MAAPLAALMLASLLTSPSAALPACPQIFGHGGYPTGANAWERDQVRQPNNPTAIRKYKSWGASGVEADLQLTKDGTKAVMWHNTWLAAMKTAGMVGLVEIKPEARQSLLSSNATIKSRAWAEVLDPVKENHRSQEIILYSHDSGLAAELKTRVSAAGMTQVLSGGPIWPEVTKWEEPPPSWTLNENAWKAALESGAKRVATDYTPQFSAWLKGKCQ
ncbi:hypothetical protein [Nonomuraea sp. B19D2]|uniref:hypothetical protein n=1 Tax=Nonomuraea sp. B19D2 TaxID=3159561 RepID=UPI0032D9FC9C